MAVDNLRSAAISIATATIGDNSIIAGVASYPIRVHGIMFTVGGAANLTYKDGASTSLSGAVVFTGAGSSQTLQISEEPWFRTVPGNAFIISSSAAVSITGTVWYRLG